MQKIVIIGAGNVGGQAALFLLRDGFRDMLLLDVAKGLAKGKALDLEDCASLLRQNCRIEGSDDFGLLKDAAIVIITAGLPRKPGMTRDDLLKKNSEILKGLSLKIKEFAPSAIVLVVTNPVDLMTHLVSEVTGFPKSRVFGMGVSLDAGRLANLVHQELNVPVNNVEASVIGSHGQTMVPVPSLTSVAGARIERLMDKAIIGRLIQHTVERGASIVAHLGSGSAYFGPAAAISDIVKSIARDEKRIIPVCAYLNGEYGIKGIYLGVPARIGRDGVEGVIELELDPPEKEALLKSAESVRQQTAGLTAFITYV